MSSVPGEYDRTGCHQGQLVNLRQWPWKASIMTTDGRTPAVRQHLEGGLARAGLSRSNWSSRDSRSTTSASRGASVGSQSAPVDRGRSELVIIGTRPYAAGR